MVGRVISYKQSGQFRRLSGGGFEEGGISRSFVGMTRPAALMVTSPSPRASKVFHALFSGGDFHLVRAMAATIFDSSGDCEIARLVDTFCASPRMMSRTIA